MIQCKKHAKHDDHANRGMTLFLADTSMTSPIAYLHYNKMMRHATFSIIQFCPNILFAFLLAFLLLLVTVFIIHCFQIVNLFTKMKYHYVISLLMSLIVMLRVSNHLKKYLSSEMIADAHWTIKHALLLLDWFLFYF